MERKSSSLEYPYSPVRNKTQREFTHGYFAQLVRPRVSLIPAASPDYNRDIALIRDERRQMGARGFGSLSKRRRSQFHVNLAEFSDGRSVRGLVG